MVDEEPNEELLDLDESEYSLKSEFSKPSVIQIQVLRCNELRSKEMIEGHTIRTLDKSGNYKIVDIPDTRQPYIGAVIALKNTLAPEIIRDEHVSKKLNELEEKKKNLFEKYKYKEIKLSYNKEEEPIAVYTGNEYIPKKGALIARGIVRSSNGPKEDIIEGLWDNKINAYWDEMITLYDDIFSLINILIDRNDYFKPNSGW